MVEYQLSQEEMTIAGDIIKEATAWGAELSDFSFRIAFPPEADDMNDFWGFKEEMTKRVLAANAAPVPHETDQELAIFVDQYYGNYPGSFMVWRNPLGEIIGEHQSFDRKTLFRNSPQGMVNLLAPFTDAWLEDRQLNLVQLLFDDLGPAKGFVEDENPLIRKAMAQITKVVLFAPDRRRLGISHTMNRFLDWGLERIDIEGYGISTPGLRLGSRLTRVIGSFLPDNS